MSLTFSLLTALLWLLPGITGLIFWNNLGRRHGVRRPDQPLTALNSLALAGGISLAAHLIGAIACDGLIAVLAEQGHAGLVSPYRVVAGLMVRPTSGPNARELGPGEPLGLIEFALILIFLSYLVAVMIRHKGLALKLDGLDSHTQGWAFQHIIDPTNHGYFQLAYVLTDAVEDGRGLGYAGGIADIRLSDDGEIKALTLSEPNRFIYTIGGKPKDKSHISLPRSWGSMMRREDTSGSAAAGLMVEEAKPVGGAIYLPAARIRNLLVLNYPEQALTAVIPEVASDAQPQPPAPAENRACALVRRVASWLLS
ncbi:hypothetical protein [Sphingomonas carotinifaciens]|uniref:Uncharacterized protein n=1 Tax=Sphingomonas carotinifaciens TaxID=1166323 RepID=A0A1G7PU72_9SPHN|nr:hypothetical protein [Sphingomonas carotinifaciens]MBB4087505.1 hypothetical protein [Sphingomonas carotinifaciens]MWC45592.1 hypothetical protein [Sphingomonas carotinifaciens]SDF89794.1 hypothetical protein SAMN05216557_10780 [Sphingomonas carotinifaciens]